MTSSRRALVVGLVALLPVLSSVQGCHDRSAVQIVNVSVKNTESYRYATVGGDEEGAQVSVQAAHFSLSEIQSDSTTGFVATYVYRAAPGFVGTDYAEVEVMGGSDGVSQPRSIKTIAFHFVVHD